MLIRNARVMTCDPARPGLGILDRADVAIEDGVIVAVGEGAAHGEGIDAEGALVTPGLVDCHTHAIFAGTRAHEFALRAAGASYQEIAAAGGGINATLGPTRAAIADGSLDADFAARLDRMRAGGTTTVEVKTGYALTTEGELALLDLIWHHAFGGPMRIVSTLLAHLVPPERRGDRDAFVREICERWIPQAKLAHAIDVWCEDGAFTLAETRAILEAARRAGRPVRGHVGQLSDIGAAELLAEFGALSVDHLEFVSPAGIAALARAGTVAVMLPGACVQLRLPVPPVAALRAAGVPLAIATDLNPGSSYCETLPIQMWLATTHFGMTIEEAWLGVTRVAARALGLAQARHALIPADASASDPVVRILRASGLVGTLVPGAPADLVLWKTDDPADVPYRYGTALVDTVITRGLTA